MHKFPSARTSFLPSHQHPIPSLPLLALLTLISLEVAVRHPFVAASPVTRSFSPPSRTLPEVRNALRTNLTLEPKNIPEIAADGIGGIEPVSPGLDLPAYGDVEDTMGLLQLSNDTSYPQALPVASSDSTLPEGFLPYQDDDGSFSISYDVSRAQEPLEVKEAGHQRPKHAAIKEYSVGVLMASRLDSPFDLERCGPAIDLALEEVNEHFLAAHGIRLKKVQASYPSCSGAKAPGLAADMHYMARVIAFIGPACAFALEPVARLAAYWNRPIITGMGDQPPSEGEVSVTSGILGRLHKWRNDSSGIFKDKSEYPTLTRMSYCQCRLRLVFASIFRQFGWSHVALLLDRSDLFSFTVGKNLEHGLRKEGLLSFVKEFDGNEWSEEGEGVTNEVASSSVDSDYFPAADQADLPYNRGGGRKKYWRYQRFLRETSMYARVVILSVRGHLVRPFMLAAHSLGMTNGDWIFLDVEIFQGSYWGDHGWELKDGDDEAARTAYEALLRVSLLQPTSPKFCEFSERVKEKAKRNYNYTFSENEEVNFFIGAFYDGVYLLGMALNETLSEGGSILDGSAITRRMWDRDFHGITGHVRIDDNGDRDADYSVSDLDPETGRFEVVAHYYGLHRTYSPVEGKRVHWPGGRLSPPPDIPPCGFMGNDPACRGNDAHVVVLYVSFALGIFLAFTTTLACVTYRHLRVAADLNNMAWRVKREEVQWEIGRPFSSRLGLTQQPTHQTKTLELDPLNTYFQELALDRNRPHCSSISSSQSMMPGKVFTTVGIHKGSRVAIKKVMKKKVDVNKKLLWEIKQVRDVTHENTVRFIGACVDPPTILILSEYCHRGSLRDVLGNDHIHLDWNFRMSLIHDILKGMSYLHSSEVGAHGKLRSGNCLIDSRFVLKISDFGLRTLTTPSPPYPPRDAAFYTKLLWVAPELLTETLMNPAGIPPATQKGDVYSFAIILEEILVRGGPFEVASHTLTAQEIVEQVSQRSNPPFRPTVVLGVMGGDRGASRGSISDGCQDEQMLHELMERCWSDTPEERPTFEGIRSVVVKRLMKSHCENLMDDLLRRMEQYATNLEALVGEKTEQLSQEKRRSEELLYQVLPRQVAEQLMAGQVVRPEQFECVTVYFSDIVGFTALCAQSTPMQVVDFLNDLYSTFDRIIGFYDVYKVETIGDAYMVVSGLPSRNGDAHAKEIALMALAILDAVSSFNIRHRPDDQLRIRIGVHSGPVCAGVVGVKMPHYCLFGDTVNTASRLESTGEPLRIHVSGANRSILEKLGTFQLEERGEVELKGKGKVTTHWLLGCIEPDPKQQPLFSTDPNPIPISPPASGGSIANNSSLLPPSGSALAPSMASSSPISSTPPHNAEAPLYPLLIPAGKRPSNDIPEFRVISCDSYDGMNPLINHAETQVMG
ncbi:atrial natriuretic peptide receptor 1 isoform X2 [Ischnura elegans]|uniref:atrial natriuretic peptide receptor 1 isoform X2 n=1 Tax=Ischnura elegans TaxID=197161 RepID=UPI001ED8985C|nr:atrial natriuretic peptide receptor 1 isoform X2 [Ischnura elegans]